MVILSNPWCWGFRCW